MSIKKQVCLTSRRQCQEDDFSERIYGLCWGLVAVPTRTTGGGSDATVNERQKTYLSAASYEKIKLHPSSTSLEVVLLTIPHHISKTQLTTF
jgi:hypothetical protein